MDWIKELRIDIDRLEHFENLDDYEEVDEYKNLIVTHVKALLNEIDNIG